MALTAGIIGLPNIGKSTLFNALTKAGALAANYPFATLQPNVANVVVPDKRLEQIAQVIKPKQIVPTTFEFTDIAGLVKGASKGEGLGNQFLSHIREVDAMLHVVRCFKDDNITHVEGDINPLRDIETIEIELIFSDLEMVEKRLPRLEKKAQLKVDLDIVLEYKILKMIHEGLLSNQPIRKLPLTEEERRFIKGFGFLTAKPILYVANISEADFMTNYINDEAQSVLDYANQTHSEAILISAKIESELSELTYEDKMLYLHSIGLSESGLDKLINQAYRLIGLQTFFTAGPQEARAWTFKTGMHASECAGVIHSDFQRGFIKAETIHYHDLLETGSMITAKEKGKIRSEGKEYLVQDGDVILFRFNV